MDQEDCIRFIKTYKNYRLLWDTKDKMHNNRIKRENAWKEISMKMQQPVTTLKRRMTTLMGSYRSERSREKRSRVIRTGSEDIYQSKWFAYNLFDFLCKRETLDSESEERQEEALEDSTEPAIPSIIPIDSRSAATSVTSFSAPNGSRAGLKRKADKELDSMILCQTLKILQSSTNTSSDPYYTYALNLANELRKYDHQTLAHVKRAISNILFEADMGRFSTPTADSTNPSSPKHE